MNWDSAYTKGTLRPQDPPPEPEVNWVWYGVGAVIALVFMAYLGIWLFEGLQHA